MSLLDNDKELFNNTDLTTIYSKGFPIIGYKTNAILGAGTGFHWRNKDFFSGTIYENEFALYIKPYFSYRDFDNCIDTWEVSFYGLRKNSGYNCIKVFYVNDILDSQVAIRTLYLFLELIKNKRIQENEKLIEYGDKNLKVIFESLIPEARKIEQHYKETDPWYGWEEK